MRQKAMYAAAGNIGLTDGINDAEEAIMNKGKNKTNITCFGHVRRYHYYKLRAYSEPGQAKLHEKLKEIQGREGQCGTTA